MAHIALTCYDLEAGGIARVAAYLARGFAEEGHRVSLILCSGLGQLDAQLREEIGNDVHITTLTRRAHSKRAFGQMATWWQIRKWLRREKPDILLSTSNNISWFSGLARVGMGQGAPRFYVKTTNPILRKADGPLLTRLRQIGYARLFGSADAVLTLSDAESSVLEGQFPQEGGQFRSVFNPYLTDAFLEQPTEGAAISGNLTFLGVGRLAPQKNFPRAIRAFARARALAKAEGRDEWVGAKLIIAGEGPLEGQLRELISSLGLDGAVELAGFVTDIPALLVSADRFLLSSNYEGLPAVVIEALGSGCPVISTDCFPAARELLDDVPACRVTAEDDNALAQAMLSSAAETVDEEKLRERATNYSLPSAIRSHLTAMGL